MDSSVGNDDVNNPPNKTSHEGVDDDLKYMLIQLCEEVNFLRMIRKESEERMRHLVTDQHKHERQLEEEILKNSLLKEKHEQKLIDLDASYQDKIRQLTREKNKLIWENESWEKDLKSVKDEVRSLQLEKYNLERMIKEQSHLLKTQTAAGEGYMKQATLFEERFTSMKHSVESCNAQVMNLSKEVNEAKILNERLTFINAHHACLKRDLEGKVEYKERLISELEVKIKLQNATIEMKPPEKEERSELLLLEKVQQMKANEDVIRKQLDNAQHRIGELSIQLEEAQLLLDQYLTIHQKYKDEVSIMEDEKKDMHNKIIKLEKERSKEEMRGKQIEKEMDRLRKEWNEKEKSFDVKLSNLNSKVENLNEANNTLDMQNNLLETKRKELLIKVKNQQEECNIPKVDVGTMADIHSVSNPNCTNSAVQTCDVIETSIIQPPQSTTSNGNNNKKNQQSEVSLGGGDGVTSFQTDRKNSHYKKQLSSSTTDGALVIMTSESSKLDHSKKELVDHHPAIHPASEGADIRQPGSDATVQEGVYETDVPKVMSGIKHPEIMESKCNDSECKLISAESLYPEESSKEEIPNIHMDSSHLYEDNSIAIDGADLATDIHKLPDQFNRQLKNSAPETGRMNFFLNGGECKGKSSCSKPKDGDMDPRQIALPPTVVQKIDENVCAVDEEPVTVSGANVSTPRKETYAVIDNVDAVATANEPRFPSSKHEIGGSLEIATQVSTGRDPCIRLHPENETSVETRTDTEVEDHNSDNVFSQCKNNSQNNFPNIEDEQDVQNESPIRVLASEKQKDTTLPKRVVDVEEFIDIAKTSENLPGISERDYTVSDTGGRIAETASPVLNTLVGVDSTLNGEEDHSTGGPILDINAPDVDDKTILHLATSTHSVSEKNFAHPCKDEVTPNIILSSGNETDAFRNGVVTKKSQDEDDERKKLTSENGSQFLTSGVKTDVLPTVDQSANPSVDLSNFIKRKGVAEWPTVGHDVCPYISFSSQEAEQSKPQVTGGTFTPSSVLTSSGVWLAGDQQSCPPLIDVRRSTVNAGRSTNTISNFIAPTGKLHSPLTLIGVTTSTDVQIVPTTSYSSSSVVSSYDVPPDSLKDPPNRLKGSSEICPDQVRMIPVKYPTVKTNPDPILTSVEAPLPRMSIAEVEPLKVNFERNIKIVLKDVKSVSTFVSELNPQHEKSAANLASNGESLPMSRAEVPSNTRQAEDKDVHSSGTVQKRPYQFEDPSEMNLFSDEEDDISSSLSKEIERARNILSRSRLKRPRSCRPTLRPISGELQEE